MRIQRYGAKREQSRTRLFPFCLIILLSLLGMIPFSVYFRNQFSKNVQSISAKHSAKHAQEQHGSKLQPVDCSKIPADNDPHFTLVTFPQVDKQVVIDYPWWSGGKDKNLTKTDEMYAQVFEEVLPNELYIDVGANIGQMTLPGIVASKLTYAFDPLLYDVTKICSGLKETLVRGLATQEGASKLHLFRALVGNESQSNVSISRPEEAFGKFEQASLFSNTIGVARKPKLVTEHVPMVTLDEMVPPDMPIGLVKIDVQGFELQVVQGMKGLLERKSGFPHIIHYEEQARLSQLAGVQMGTVQSLLETYGYNCKRIDKNDITCMKPRQDS